MVCTPGDQKCIGADLYRCRQYYDTVYHEYRTEWYFVEGNSPQCVVEPPEPEPAPEPEPEPPPAPYVSLSWIGSIFSFVGDISDWFLSAYQEVSDWIWPFYFLQYPFYGLYRIFKDLLTPIATFWLWAEDIATKVVSVFTSDGILGLIQWWFPDLGSVIEWFIGRWNWFISAVGDWWDETKETVLGWIDIVKQWFLELIDAVAKDLAQLWAKLQWFFDNLMTLDEIIQWWKDWLGRVAAALIRWGFITVLDVGSLIISAFLEREDFWAGWQDMRGMVTDFFADPVDFIFNKIDEFFERYW